MVSRGLLGLKAQGLVGRRLVLPILVQVIEQGRQSQPANPQTGSYTATEDLLADIFGWGSGASGNSSATQERGGGGGAAFYSRLMIPRGETISWSVAAPGAPTSSSTGAAGGDTTVTVGDLVMTAQGGRAGSEGGGAARSVATGGQYNRYGGGTNEPGEFGVTAPFSGNAMGGGSGGFSDLFGPSTAGVGGTSADPLRTGGSPGGGGRANSGGGNFSNGGGEGRVSIFLYRIAN